MPAQQEQSNSQGIQSSQMSYEELVRKIAQRVWELWREDLRRARERGGRQGKK